MIRRLTLTIVCVAATMAAMAQTGLKISELLYQPRSGEAEYLELYNDSGNTLELSEYHIVRVVGDSLGKHYPLPSYALAPRDYVVLTKDAASVIANYDVRNIAKLLECQLPTYPNDGGSVVLVTADSLPVERFDYLPSMHSPMLHNAAGVSLERRSFERPVDEASNWFSASSVSGYGTPGYANSQSTEWLVAETVFELSSTVVSPDGDGYEDVLSVEYRMERPDLLADIEVYDAAGNKVAQLLNAALLGTHGSVEWSAEGAARGRYLLVINLYDRSGQRQKIRRTVAVYR